jgi:hypothetical protein
MSFVANWGPFSPNGVFYCMEPAETFIKQDHQIATIDIQKVSRLASNFTFVTVATDE